MPASIIADKSYQFSIRIVKIHLHLCKTRKDIYSLSKQLLRAGTSIGANVEEAIGGAYRTGFFREDEYSLQRSQGNPLLVASFERLRCYRYKAF